MADKKISELTAITTVADADLFAIVDVSVSETKKVTVTQLASFFTTELGLAVPNNQIVHGNSAGDGIESSANFTWDGETLISNGAALQTAPLFSLQKAAAKYFEIDSDGQISWINGANVVITTVGTDVYFPSGAVQVYALTGPNDGLPYIQNGYTTGNIYKSNADGDGIQVAHKFDTYIAHITGNKLASFRNDGDEVLFITHDGAIGFVELPANGTNYVAFKPPTAITTSLTWTLPATDSTGTQALVSNGSGVLSWASIGGGSGTVTSFSAGDLFPLFTTSEATVTTTPALSFSLNTQNANKVFAGPATGADAAPTFRVLVAADIPSLSGTYLTVDGATTGATSQAQVFTNGIKTPAIDDNTAGLIEISFSNLVYHQFTDTALQVRSGSIAAPSLSFLSDASSGIYLKGAGAEIGVSVNSALVGGFDATGLFAGLAGTLTGTLKFNGATSGTVTVQSAAAAGTWTLTLPTTDGNSGEFLQTNGSGVTTWAAVSVYTDEQAQDAVGAMIDTTLVYVDATPLLTRAALTGDVTAPQGSNATTIANDAVTYAKMQNVSATDRLLGRSTAGAGDVEEITCTSFGRSLIDDADAATARATLGAGYDLTSQTANGVTLGTGATVYAVPFFGGSFNATETNRQLTIKSAGVAQKLYVRTNSAQSGLGSLVVTVRKNAANTAITLTIAAGAAAGTFTDLSNTVSFAAGDLISFKIVNNAAATSANIMEVGVFVQ